MLTLLLVLSPSMSPEVWGDRGESKEFDRVGDLPAGTLGAGKAVLVLHPIFCMRLPGEAAWRWWCQTAAAWGWVSSLFLAEAAWREREMLGLGREEE